MTEAVGQASEGATGGDLRGQHLLLYDGVCGLCDRLVQFVLARDRRGVFDFAPLQSETGRAAVAREGGDPDALTSFYVVRDYRTDRARSFVKGRAALFVARTLGWPWSLAAMFHAAARSVLAFLLARVALGVAESAAYPGAVKAVAEWFPRRERALGVGILNAGANVGVMMTPIVGLLVAGLYGWQAAFLVTGAIGFAVLLGWLVMFRQPSEHPRVGPAELAHIEQDGEDASGRPLGWGEAIRQRQAWYFICGKFFTDPVWYLFLFWLPDFFVKTQGLDLFPKADSGILSTIGPALIGVYLLADIGSIVGVKQITLAVRKFSKCGRPSEVYGYQGLDADAIVEACGRALSETALESLRVDPAVLERIASGERRPGPDWRELWPAREGAK